jgi:hypothetical protein
VKVTGCCARATSGQAAAPPTSVMNWRRIIQSSPEAQDHAMQLRTYHIEAWRYGAVERGRKTGPASILCPADGPLLPQALQ